MFKLFKRKEKEKRSHVVELPTYAIMTVDEMREQVHNCLAFVQGVREFLDDRDFWVCTDGRIIAIETMQDAEHLWNILAWINRRAQTTHIHPEKMYTSYPALWCRARRLNLPIDSTSWARPTDAANATWPDVHLMRIGFG